MLFFLFFFVRRFCFCSLALYLCCRIFSTEDTRILFPGDFFGPDGVLLVLGHVTSLGVFFFGKSEFGGKKLKNLTAEKSVSDMYSTFNQTNGL